MFLVYIEGYLDSRAPPLHQKKQNDISETEETGGWASVLSYLPHVDDETELAN